MELGLFQTQSLKLVMTNELRQAITILQYPTLELSNFLQQQATENPIIELIEKPLPTTKMSDRAEGSDTWYYGEDDTHPINYVKAEEPSLQDHLIEQLAWLDICDQEKAVSEYLIYCLDENGYLDCSLDQLQIELGVSESLVIKALENVQQLEPIGVGARSLAECLKIQYNALNENSIHVQAILEDHLQELADRKYNELSKKLQISLEELKQAEDTIRSLNPRPCSEYNHSRSEWVQPEFFIEKNNAGEYKLRMNEELVPEVTLNDRYFRMLERHSDAKAYLERQLQKYEWLKRSLEQRRQTLERLGDYLVDKQHDFFEQGYEALKPMTLKEVAEAIEVHESTISRAVKNKTIQTPRGTITLKSLFTSKIDNGHHSEDTSSAQVKIKIKRMIEEERKQKPLSDQKIADNLKSDGIAISRRTVAKYREELRIPSSSKRKSLVV
ncbi:RNA polymerase factor sigma-54 [Pseudalkalibacillus berkeleyi]|uniref:RNA polymerase factor sigma-54 n=1 Tax=Pseudalkalibacillus berkeleyi TaxID=1069813 RepID=A0ABS9H105_9BACL|nr:RNA polymerase factor sigma-54 [Pseudalkalibacillus berkeleyi]MCF6138672.1 RNA polymerase factor sigma-54 [Pseudalkalibacillus berkeleyi]